MNRLRHRAIIPLISVYAWDLYMKEWTELIVRVSLGLDTCKIILEELVTVDSLKWRFDARPSVPIGVQNSHDWSLVPNPDEPMDSAHNYRFVQISQCSC